jgi:hypothetical protein
MKGGSASNEKSLLTSPSKNNGSDLTQKSSTPGDDKKSRFSLI